MNRPECIRDVLIGKTRDIRKLPFNQKIPARFLGHSVLTSDGDEHQRKRKMLQPAFHAQRIHSDARVMGEYTSQMLSAWRDGDHLNIKHEMSALTMQIVAKTLFDVVGDVDVQPVGDALSVLQNRTVTDFKRGFMTPAWLPSTSMRKMKEALYNSQTSLRIQSPLLV